MDQAASAGPALDPRLLELAGAADRGEAAPAAAAEISSAPPAPLGFDYRGACLGIVEDWAPAIAAFLPPACAARLTPDRVQRIGLALARTAERFGWTWIEKADNPLIALGREIYVVADPVVTPLLLSHLKLQPGGANLQPGGANSARPAADPAAIAAPAAAAIAASSSPPAGVDHDLDAVTGQGGEPAQASAPTPAGVVKEVKSADSTFRIYG